MTVSTSVSCNRTGSTVLCSNMLSLILIFSLISLAAEAAWRVKPETRQTATPAIAYIEYEEVDEKEDTDVERLVDTTRVTRDDATPGADARLDAFQARARRELSDGLNLALGDFIVKLAELLGSNSTGWATRMTVERARLLAEAVRQTTAEKMVQFKLEDDRLADGVLQPE